MASAALGARQGWRKLERLGTVTCCRRAPHRSSRGPPRTA